MSNKYEYDYPMPGITADIAVLCNYKFLVIERSDGRGWALPGGFLNPNENITQCAIRELKEETGIIVDTDEYFHLFGVYSEPNRDDRSWTVTNAFLYDLGIDGDFPDVIAADDAITYKWINKAEIDERLVKLCFDHREILMDIMYRVCK